MLSIKKAGVEDIPTIRALSLEVWPPTYISILGEAQVAYMLGLFYSPAALEKQMRDGHHFILCYENNKPVAFASYSEIEYGIYKLHKLYTLTTEQKKGIGAFMLNYIVNDLRSRSAIALRLNVNRYNYPAKSFYEKMGFTHYMDEDIDIGSGFYMNDHVLELVINYSF